MQKSFFNCLNIVLVASENLYNVHTYSYNYDNNNNLSQMNEDYGDGTTKTYIYNESGYIIKTTETHRNYSYISYYDDNGIFIADIDYYDDYEIEYNSENITVVVEYNSAGLPTREYAYYYDDRGRLTNKIYHNNSFSGYEEGNVTTYTYNDAGNLLRKYITARFDEYEYNYTYDEYENLVKEEYVSYYNNNSYENNNGHLP